MDENVLTAMHFVGVKLWVMKRCRGGHDHDHDSETMM